MKVNRPAEEIEVCDRCHNTGFLQTCIVCGARFCLTCRGTVAGCGIGPDLCRNCARRDDVKKACDKCAGELRPIIRKRNGLLKRLRKKVLAERAKEA